MSKKEWFQDWFDTPYYHILYKNRDHNEAESFIRNLITFLQPKKETSFLDLACGKGRHSIYLHSMGHIVSGCDLSKSSIEYAKQFEKENLRFFVHDMRLPTKSKYDCILSLFTSFGYFDSPEDNQQMFDSIYSDLNSDGRFILDFLNEKKVRQEINAEEVKTEDGIAFKIRKEIKNNRVIKKIDFSANDQQYSFEERVELLSLDQIKSYAQNSGFEIEQVFGNYKLSNFEENSERLILIFKKK